MTSTPTSPIFLILKAAHFSADRHRDQRRNGCSRNTPYINHPLEVAERLSRAGIEDATVLVAAILHDTIEDTETTAAEIAREFGPHVAHIVAELTIDKEPYWTVRKRNEIDGAANLSPKAKLVKLADKTSNVSDTMINPPGDWTLQRRRDYLEFARRCRWLSRRQRRTRRRVRSRRGGGGEAVSLSQRRLGALRGFLTCDAPEHGPAQNAGRARVGAPIEPDRLAGREQPRNGLAVTVEHARVRGSTFRPPNVKQLPQMIGKARHGARSSGKAQLDLRGT